jgi:hypothetical protein
MKSFSEHTARMPSRTDVIEVDQISADRLKAPAAERGISVAELLAE